MRYRTTLSWGHKPDSVPSCDMVSEWSYQLLSKKKANPFFLSLTPLSALGVFLFTCFGAQLMSGWASSVHTEKCSHFSHVSFLPGLCDELNSGNGLMIIRCGKGEEDGFEREKSKIYSTQLPPLYLNGSHFSFSEWIKCRITFLFFLLGWLCNNIEECQTAVMKGKWMQGFALCLSFINY